MDTWVGRIEARYTDITLMLSNGTLLKVTEEDQDIYNLEDISEKRSKTSEFVKEEIYVGQVLKGSIDDLCGNYEIIEKHSGPCSKHIAVVQVETRAMDVHWLCKGYSESQNNCSPPPSKLTKADLENKLKKLNCFESSTVQIGDMVFYKIKPNDNIVEYSKSYKTVGNFVQQFIPDSNSHGQELDELLKFKNLATENKINEHADLVPTKSESDSDYEDMESDTGSNASNSSSSSRKKRAQKGPSLQTRLAKRKQGRGKIAKKEKPLQCQVKPGNYVPCEIIYTSSNVEVMWQDGTIQKNIPSTDLYPIHHLDEREFFPGDVVLSNNDEHRDQYGVVQTVDHGERTCTIHWMTPYETGKGTRPTYVGHEEVSVYDIKDHEDYSYRPGTVVVRIASSEDANAQACGQVYEIMTDGRLKIQWGDTTQSFCYPQELYTFGEEMSEFGSDDDYSDEDSDGTEATDNSWETQDEAETSEEDTDNENDQTASGGELPNIPESSLQGYQDRLNEARHTIEALRTNLTTQSDILPFLTVMYQSIIKCYKSCRKLDNQLDTSYFDADEIKDLISVIRRSYKKERASELTAHVMGLFQSPAACMAQSGDAGEDTEQLLGEAAAVDTADTSPEPSKKDAESQTHTNSSKKAHKAKRSCENACRLLKEGMGKIQRDLDHLKKRNLEKMNDSNKTPEKQKIVGFSEPCRSNTGSPFKDLSGAKVPTSLSNTGLNVVSKLLTELELENDDNDNDSLIDMLVTHMGLDIPPGNSGIEKSSDIKSPVSDISDLSATMENIEAFKILDTVPEGHRFKKTPHQPVNLKSFTTAVRKEMKLLCTSLPSGIFVRGFDERMDIFSVMIYGPEHTPYEDGLFFFDVMLPADYPESPPLFHYLSYCNDRLNPNLYEDGKVCVSLLGTWSGKDTEVWTNKSNLLQVLVSIQGLILVKQPYYNEAGYEKQQGTQQGLENSKVYNEMAVIKMVQSMQCICKNPPEVFKEDAIEYLNKHGYRLADRVEKWLDYSVKNQLQKTPTKPSSLPTNQSQLTSTLAVNILPQNCQIPNDHLVRKINLASIVDEAVKKVDNPASRVNDSTGEANSHGNNKATDNQDSEKEPGKEDNHFIGDKTPDENNIPIGNDDINKANEKNETDNDSNEQICAGAGIPKVECSALPNLEVQGSLPEFPDFPLLPGSRGFCLTLSKLLARYKETLKNNDINNPFK
ncbi:unnamed protein product [Owenia fusiformis]|uniref:UBC core domain-containing protein n=1 Tax=Owenia fusiformis TaxID=6347 RepID=A0A8S4PK10_OWEFU|nr:unnamed protein product [Owenia fusiformis]